MRCKKNIRNLILLTMMVSLPILSKPSVVNADSIEDEISSVINKYDLKDIVVEPGVYLTKGETLDLSQYPNWELSDNETIEINSNGIARAVNEGTVFLSQRIGEKVSDILSDVFDSLTLGGSPLALLGRKAEKEEKTYA